MDAMADVAAPTRVVIADDDVLLREGLASLLERSRFEVVGQSGTDRPDSVRVTKLPARISNSVQATTTRA